MPTLCRRVLVILASSSSFFFFFNDTATTEIYTLSLHDALPILWVCRSLACMIRGGDELLGDVCHKLGVKPGGTRPDRKSTRLNSSHTVISYAVFCLKKKKKTNRRSGDRVRPRHLQMGHRTGGAG